MAIQLELNSVEIPKRIARLRRQMEWYEMDMYIVPTSDFHNSEYVGDYFRCREYITGFTGSAGTAVITKDSAYLWTDGRYFLQAGYELEGTGVTLMKMGEPGVPTLERFIFDELEMYGTIGFDGRVVTKKMGEKLTRLIAAKKGRLIADRDLIGEIWEDRPPMSTEPAFLLDEKYSGESTASKLERLHAFMESRGVTSHLLTTLDDICWLLNIRGKDVKYSPLVLCYAIVTMNKVHLYIDDSKLDQDMREVLDEQGVMTHRYEDIFEDLQKLALVAMPGADTAPAETILYDPAEISYALYKAMPDTLKRIEARNPEILFKAIKNGTEIENIREAELKDSVAHVRFMKWLKENVHKGYIKEMFATEMLDRMRGLGEGYIGPSFAPIGAFGEHGAIIHYSADEVSNARLKEGSLFLTDTGGNYYEGSTDITRTYALGEVPQEMKEHFTLVAISNLRLAAATFKKGCTGVNLDIVARQPLWEKGLDFNHGTGHGIGYLLNIHEGPQAIRWRYIEGETAELEAGMIVTDEPGLYFAGSHGIRLENELLVCEGEKNEYGQFMHFETLTFVPFDLDAIVPEMMSADDKELLNSYHAEVYNKLADRLNGDERDWLKYYTREI